MNDRHCVPFLVSICIIYRIADRADAQRGNSPEPFNSSLEACMHPIFAAPLIELPPPPGGKKKRVVDIVEEIIYLSV